MSVFLSAYFFVCMSDNSLTDLTQILIDELDRNMEIFLAWLISWVGWILYRKLQVNLGSQARNYTFLDAVQFCKLLTEGEGRIRATLLVLLCDLVATVV